MYNVHTLVIGDMATNCYIVSNPETKNAIVIDPADTPEYIGEKLVEMGVTPVAMIATHGHFDHVLGAFGLQVFFPDLPFFMHPKDSFLLKRMQKTALHFGGNRTAPPAAQRVLDITDFKDALLGEESIEILSLPGHTPGSIGVYLKVSSAVFVGDLMFADGSVGETHHQYSDKNALKKSIEKIMSLPSNTKIYSGHGEMILVSDVGQERVY